MSRKRGNDIIDNGFEGGYMNAKIAKLEQQFADKVLDKDNRISNIFNGVSIFVNGYTKPSATELKCIMSEHGGVFHHYFSTSKTNFIIASNLPDVKVKNLPTTRVVKPEWITDSIKTGHLLDYKKYILYSNLSKTQPRLTFDIENINTTDIPYNKDDIKPNLEQDADVADSTLRTAANPKFLGEYYNNSRLHHISQLGAGFKQYINDLREKSEFTFPLRATLKQHSNTDIKLENSCIMHIDMDCFFVSVGLRDHPNLNGQPVAVTHAKNSGGTQQQREGVDVETEFKMYSEKRKKNIEDCQIHKGDPNKFQSFSEIASCSYEARAMGLHNGMFMGEAVKLCPNLKTIPYNFDAYKEVAFTLYDTIAQYTLNIEAVSCDEMYVDCKELLEDVGLSPLDFATLLRNEIKYKTKCPCSVGFGENRLQARLATKSAKPNGQYQLLSDDVESYFRNIRLSDLPGVGRTMQHKLTALGYTTCGELWSASLDMLRKNFGNKTGNMLYSCIRGRDDRALNFTTVRKSISATANYGIRFKDNDQYTTFMKQLCQEVHSRMLENKVRGKSITVKLMVRDPDAPVETAKFMGHGVCNNIAKMINLKEATDDLELIISEVLNLCAKMNMDPEELRGISIQVTKLICHDKKSVKKNSIKNFLTKKHNDQTKSQRITEKATISSYGNESNFITNNKKNIQANNTMGLVKRRGRPPKNIMKLNNQSPVKNIFNNQNKKITSDKMEVLDQDVLNALPDDIRHEVLANYGKNTFREYRETRSENYNENKKPEQQNETESSKSIMNTENLPLDTSSNPDISNLHWRDVCKMMKIWMESSSGPLTCDVKLVNTYLQGLVMARKIEDVYDLVNLAYRMTFTSGRCDWHSAYREMVNSVQETMIMVYEKRMALLNKFECCGK